MDHPAADERVDALEQLENSLSSESDLPDFLRKFVSRLLDAPLLKKGKKLIPEVNVGATVEEIRAITLHAIVGLSRQPSLLRLNNCYPMHIVGDLHGQFHDLRSIFARCGHPSTTAYLFLGDYVDRGMQGVETAILLLALKTLHPTKVFLLRGNHEDFNTSMVYGFFDECVLKYGPADGEMVWLHMVNAFNHLPVSALVGGKILCMHGGISPHIESLDDINKIVRPTMIPSYGLMCDLLWSDPEVSKNPGWLLSARGISFSFDDSVIEGFCRKHNIDLIVRAHQICSDMVFGGYKFHANGRMLTVFSAPFYLNLCNDGCVVRVDHNLRVRFVILRPPKDTKTRQMVA